MVAPKRPDPITITRAQYMADTVRFSALATRGVVIRITDETGKLVGGISDGGTPTHTCRTCGEYTDLDDEAAEDEHGW